MHCARSPVPRWAMGRRCAGHAHWGAACQGVVASFLFAPHKVNQKKRNSNSPIGVFDRMCPKYGHFFAAPFFLLWVRFRRQKSFNNLNCLVTMPISRI